MSGVSQGALYFMFPDNVRTCIHIERWNIYGVGYLPTPPVVTAVKNLLFPLTLAAYCEATIYN